jgi:hypothetical protein
MSLQENSQERSPLSAVANPKKMPTYKAKRISNSKTPSSPAMCYHGRNLSVTQHSSARLPTATPVLLVKPKLNAHSSRSPQVIARFKLSTFGTAACFAAGYPSHSEVRGHYHQLTITLSARTVSASINPAICIGITRHIWDVCAQGLDSQSCDWLYLKGEPMSFIPRRLGRSPAPLFNNWTHRPNC